MLGLSLLLLATTIVWIARAPGLLGYLVGFSGFAYIAQGFVLGSEGFSGANTAPQLLAYVAIFAWSSWLLIVAWRMKEAVEAPT